MNNAEHLQFELAEQPKSQNSLINSSSSSEEANDSSNRYKPSQARQSLLTQEQEEGSKPPKKAKDSTKTFKRLFEYTWKNRCIFIVANLSLLLSSGAFILLPWFCGQLFDSIKEGKQLLNSSMYFISIGLIMSIFLSLKGYSFNVLGERIMLQLRSQLFSSLVQKDINFYDCTKTGQLMSRLGNDVAVVYSVCSDNVASLIKSFLEFIGCLGLLWFLSWKLTIYTILLLPVVTLIILKMMNKMKETHKQYSNVMASTTAFTSQIFSNIRTVRSFATEPHENHNYQTLLSKVYSAGRAKHGLYALMLTLMTLFTNGLILVVFYFGGNMVKKEEMTIGNLASFVMYALTMAINFGGVTGIVGQVVSALAVCEKLFEIMDQPIEIVSGTKKIQLNQEKEAIVQFKNVSFSYPSKPTVQVLHNLTFSITQGESVAIVGPSGSGKSSIVSLILRFYDVNQGQVLINGVDIKEVNVDKMRQQIGLVSQEPTLFSGSLSQNIQYGIKEKYKTEEIVEEALTVSHSNQFVKNPQLFPQGINTIVGERGIKLSGGQKQRIAIARCIAKNPKIMIFDQATSALDGQSEYQVQQAIDDLVSKRDRTVIIVAHRLSTIIGCDRILVVKEGRVVEEGKHRELVEKEGVYAKLVRRQLTKEQHTKEEEEELLEQ